MALIATGATATATAAPVASPAASSMASELMAQGRESAAVLEALLHGASLPPAHGGAHALAAEILRCCDRALAALRAGGDAESSSADTKRKPATAQPSTRRRRRYIYMYVSSRSCDGARDRAATQQEIFCRATASGGGAAAAAEPARVEKARTSEDGFLWRKYGQKEIKNSKHPRFYYRCSYKDDHGCTATKQVQQSETADDDTASPVYIITYFGEHTCRHGDDAAAMVVDGGEEEDQLSPAQMVISFASSNGGDASVSWPCSGDDAQNNSETSHESSPPEAPAGEEERLRPCTAAGVSDEPIMESTPPAPELLADLKPMDGCLLDGESLFGMDELVYFHELSAALGLLDRDWGAPV